VLAELATDPVSRVRAAAARALGLVGESEHADALGNLLADLDSAARVAAERALRVLSRRLDRDLTR
jgi:HEAT repeat protein